MPEIVPTHSNDSNYTYPITLGSAVGIELEYMIVDADTLNVRPIADELIRAVAGVYQSDAEPDGPDGAISWSNELALHVIELKTTNPVPDLDSLAAGFHRQLRHMTDILSPFNARLMPTAMHPWMDPHTELRLWPHEYSPVYAAYDRVFSCRGHGWANLQSTHVNLPFGNDDEFGRLHAAIRLMLPIIPAIAASSPIADGQPAGLADTRIETYRHNADRIPSIAGQVIPEAVFSRRDYERDIFARIYRDIAPLDPDGILQHEWLNSRGGIARFDRGSIEIRLIDIQECPAADIAIVHLIMRVVDALTKNEWSSQAEQRTRETDALASLLLECTRLGEQAVIADPRYLAAFGIASDTTADPTAGQLWQSLADRLIPHNDPHRPALDTIFTHGTLSTRILRSLAHSDLPTTYRTLCNCLDHNDLFVPDRSST